MQTIAKSFTTLFALVLAAGAVGCSSSNGDGSGCSYGGNWYAEGESFDDADGCNTCSCQNGEIACTLMGCVGAPCTYDGVDHNDGESFDASDGCNTCNCQDGEVACTEKGCVTTCDYGGVTYAEGDTFPDADGCNSCGCVGGQVECTLIECQGTVDCGGELGDTCAENEYCAYTDPVALCGAADETAICQPRPQACPELDAPVCGCDGVSYDNQCQAARAGVGLSALGSCASRYVCSFDGAIYENGETFEFLSHDGCNTCSCDNGTVECTAIPCPGTPNCAYDGVVYEDGESFGATDGCNSCTCTNGSVSCTELDCPTTCTYGGVVYADGESFDASDGCNSCVCNRGIAACTLMICGSSCNYEGATHPAGTTFPASDGCNRCDCNDGVVDCTTLECDGMCGGFLGDTCAEDEYCAYVPGEMCGAFDLSSTCKPRPGACTGDVAPVCGCDGNTYSNQCVAAVAGTGVMSEGACES